MSVMIELRPSAGPVLVVGGGAVALRRVRNLSDGGFRITVVAPSILDEIRGLPGVTCFARTFIDTDIPDGESRWALVLACTGERDVNRRIGEAARAHAIPVVVADSQDESTFFTPATLRDGGLQVAVSTAAPIRRSRSSSAKRSRPRLAPAGRASSSVPECPPVAPRAHERVGPMSSALVLAGHCSHLNGIPANPSGPTPLASATWATSTMSASASGEEPSLSRVLDGCDPTP